MLYKANVKILYLYHFLLKYKTNLKVSIDPMCFSEISKDFHHPGHIFTLPYSSSKPQLIALKQQHEPGRIPAFAKFNMAIIRAVIQSFE